jgi:hypothetical protein
MPRMNILNTVERQPFHSPPVFSSFQPKQYFGFPSKLGRFAAGLRNPAYQPGFLLSAGYFVKLNSATNDANDGSDGSSDDGDANTGSNNIGNQDSSRRNTACSRLEHQIQKSRALQPSLDSAPRKPDRARREVVTDTFSYV